MRPLECEATGPRLFSRADALAILKIGETTLFWLQRTGKLRPIRIGSRVLFNAAEIERLAIHGATLTGAEKKQPQTATPLVQRASVVAGHARLRPPPVSFDGAMHARHRCGEARAGGNRTRASGN
jgi:hypothetical protein